MEQTKSGFEGAAQVGLPVITTLVSILANEFDVLSVFHRQVRLTVVNQNCVLHESMNG